MYYNTKQTQKTKARFSRLLRYVAWKSSGSILRRKDKKGRRQVRKSKQKRISGKAYNINKQTIHTHPFNGHLSGTTRVSQYQKGKTNLDFTEARDSEWQWHRLGHMQVCTSLQTNNHTSTPPLSFLQAGCPSWHPTKSVEALKAESKQYI